MRRSDPVIDVLEPNERGHVRVRADAQLCEICEQAAAVALRHRLKPIRRPSVRVSERAEIEAEIRARFGPELVLTTAVHSARPQQIDLIYGMSAADVDEFVRLTSAATDLTAPDDHDAIKRRIGALLGYPPCCVDAFIHAAASEEDLTERTLLARRFGAGVLDPRWPLLLLVYEHYLPCSLHCERSLALADALEAALAEDGVEAPAGGWGRIVFLTEMVQPGNVAVMLRGELRPDGFDYRLIALNHADDVLAPVLDGDRLRFDGPRLEVLRGDVSLHVFAGSVALFDVEREWGDSRWFAAHFEALSAADAHASVTDEPAPQVVETPAPQVFAGESAPTVEQVRAAIEQLGTPRLELLRCEAGPAGDSPHAWIRAQLDGEIGRFVLTVVPRPLDGFVAGGVAARLDPSGDVEAQQAVIAELAARFDPRATTPTPDSDAARVLAIVRAAWWPGSGEFVRLVGFAACWPICDQGGITHVALVANGEVLELFVAARAGRESWPGKTTRLAVGHPSSTPLRSDRARAAFARFVQLLRKFD